MVQDESWQGDQVCDRLRNASIFKKPSKTNFPGAGSCRFQGTCVWIVFKPSALAFNTLSSQYCCQLERKQHHHMKAFNLNKTKCLRSSHQCHWWESHQEGTLYDRASISRSSFQSFQTRLWQPSVLLLLQPSCILHCFQPSKVHIHATLLNTSHIFSFLINSLISSCIINN